METTTRRPSLLNAALIAHFGIQTAAELIDSTLTLAAAETLSGVRCWERFHLDARDVSRFPLADPALFTLQEADMASFWHLDGNYGLLDCEWRKSQGSNNAICITPRDLEGRKPLRPLPVLWHETAYAEGYVPEWRGEYDDLPVRDLVEVAA
jgi:hypothetical protein